MIDCRVNLEFRNEMYEDANINIIDEVKMKEDNNNLNPSMIVYIVKEGDTIWDIAKKYKTSVAKIANINELPDENKLDIGQKILIIR